MAYHRNLYWKVCRRGIPFVQKVKELKGNITVIHKLGLKHPPHSIPTTTPIVNFILKAVNGNKLFI